MSNRNSWPASPPAVADADVLREFFAISPRQIEAEMDCVGRGKATLGGATFRNAFQHGQSSTSIAQQLHQQLVAAGRLCQQFGQHHHLTVLAVGLAGLKVAEIASREACLRGRLGRLNALLGDGLTFGENDRGLLLEEEADRLLRRVEDTVFTAAICRYGFEGIALLYEESRSLFEVQMEVGRRLLLPRAVRFQESRQACIALQRDYGKRSVRLLERHLRKAGL